MSKPLVLYFSAEFGKTRQIAQMVAKSANADIFEIEAEIPYTKDDLYWPNPQCRSVVESLDRDCRPAFAKRFDEIENYETIFLGFPIWCAVAPTVVNTFLEAHNVSGKTIIPFATSGGSGYGPSNDYLKKSVTGANLLPGIMLNNASQEKINEWVRGMNL